MLAADPDEYEMQHYEIQALVAQNDDLQAALAATQSRLESSNDVVKAAADTLAALKDRVDGLHTYDDQTLHDQLGGLSHEIEAVLQGLQQEAIT